MFISKDPVISGGYPGTFNPQPGGAYTVTLDGNTGAVASVQNGALTEAVKGSVSPNELCWVDGQFLVFRPMDGKIYWFKFTADGVAGA